MKVFLNGGGADIQTIDAYKKLNQVIDHTKPCLYIPLAMKQEKYDGSVANTSHKCYTDYEKNWSSN